MTALNTQVVSFTFQRGMDTKADPKVSAPGSFTNFENVSFDLQGAVGKRAGHTQLSNFAVRSGISTPHRPFVSLGTRGDDLLAFDGNTVWSWSPALEKWCGKEAHSGTFAQTDVGAFGAATVSTEHIAATNKVLFGGDHTVSGSFELHAWSVFDPMSASVQGHDFCVIDNTTNVKLLSSTGRTGTAGFWRPKVLELSGTALVASHNTDTATLRLAYGEFDKFNGSTLKHEHTGTFGYYSSFDLCKNSTNSTAYLAHYANSGQLLLSAHDNTASLLWQVTLGSNPNFKLGVGAAVGFGGVWVAHARLDAGFQPQLYIEQINTTSHVVTSGLIVSSSLEEPLSGTSTYPQPAGIGTVYSSSDSYVYVFSHMSYGFHDVTPYDGLHTENDYVRITKFPAVFGASLAPALRETAVLMRGVGLISKPFVQNNHVYVWCSNSSEKQPQAFLVREDGKVVAHALVENHAGLKPVKTQVDATFFAPGLSEVNARGDSTWSTSMEHQGELLAFSGVEGAVIKARPVQLLNVVATTAQFSDEAKEFNTLEFNGNCYTVGAQSCVYDGTSLVELGFHLSPDSDDETMSSSLGTGGSLSNSGEYRYCFTYHWRDSAGREDSSRPSAPITVTLGASNSSVLWSIPSLRQTNKRDAYVKAWRTQDIAGLESGAAAESIFQLASDPVNPILNDTLANTVSWRDTLSDETLLARPVLYTVSGELEDAPTPVARVMSSWDNRLVLGGDEQDPLRVWFSKQANERKPPAFNEALYVRCTDDSQPVTAVAPLDDKLCVFKERAVYVIPGGAGIDNLGAGSITPVQRISSDVGTSQPKSVVSTPLGTMFKTEKGISLLDTGLTFQRVGQPVERDMRDMDISSAVLVPDSNEVRWTNATADPHFCLDYVTGRWSKHTGFGAVIDSVLWLGKHVKLTGEGAVLVEDPLAYQDGSTEISTVIETGWISFQGALAGVERVFGLWLLGEAKSQHTLTVQVAFDFVDEYVESHDIDSNTVIAPSSVAVTRDPFYTGVRLDKQLCYAIKLRISDSDVRAPEGPGVGGMQISAVAMEFGVLPGRPALKTTAFMN